MITIGPVSLTVADLSRSVAFYTERLGFRVHAEGKGTARLGAGAADHLVSEALYLADPEGNGIELYRDRPREGWVWEDGAVKMTTDPLDVDSLFDEGTTLGHVHLRVADIVSTEGFYCDVLGLDLTARFGTMASFVVRFQDSERVERVLARAKAAGAPVEQGVERPRITDRHCPLLLGPLRGMALTSPLRNGARGDLP